MDNNHNPIVFISYSQDSASLADRVLEFFNKLRSEGIDTILDQYEESPAEGWPR
ncbi:MAG: toll/interleukin-1 receptor domain-containing protein [Lachnospiraceae bacterium]|nr:toll/interleukin-1 receptor domain-containing protein [Lachnospiraceae bacterium]MCM1229281.1 toll/interleukin-1 receptor domain-containing protein [Ruminococcus flavefaciens]